MKFGKKDPTYDARDIQFAHYLTTLSVDLPAHPRVFGHEGLVKTWGMLGNDKCGDCTVAGADHETMLWHAESFGPDPRYALQITEANAVSDYSAITGFDPNDSSTDNGAVVRDVLKYRKRVGIVDGHGQRHRIEGYAALEPGNWEHLLEAVYLFGAVGIGFQVPSSAMDQFDAGRPWSVVSSPGSIEGGHYVPLVAWRGNLIAITWGKPQPMTRGFFEKYSDEAWALLDDELLQQGHSPEGFNLQQLIADIRRLAA